MRGGLDVVRWGGKMGAVIILVILVKYLRPLRGGFSFDSFVSPISVYPLDMLQTGSALQVVSLDRKMPHMDHITSRQNHLPTHPQLPPP